MESEEVRELRAMLAKRLAEAEQQASLRKSLGWTSFQISDRMVLDGLRDGSARWAKYEDSELRSEALRRFDDYAYQWF